ncbi:Protocadherin Fat 4, partial [Geodia barretti]
GLPDELIAPRNCDDPCSATASSSSSTGAITIRLLPATDTHPLLAGGQVPRQARDGRLQTHLRPHPSRLDPLHERAAFTVRKAWSEFPDSDVADSQSLHYEGRTIRVYVQDQRRVSEFLTNAVQAAFDWVSYQSNNYVRLSVIPDNCENNVDLVFILDQSGSVGSYNHALAILFILNVIQYFSISPDATRVGFVAYSRRSHVEFDLNDFTTAESLAVRISNINYRGGATATALALNDTAFLLNPDSNRGARPTSRGIPKVALLITDGKSNQYPLTYAVPHIKSLGIQVYALGIANPDVNELQFIASDPDIEHVFLLNSYNDAAGFVDFLTIQTCDTPAIIDPGDNTTTEVPEGGIRYFQVQCDSFSNMVLVELYDNTGTSFLYCSATEANPGPLTSNTAVNNTVGITVRTCVVSLANTNSRVVYIGVRGADEINQFTVVVWDQLFSPAEEEIVVLEGQTGAVYEISANFNAGANGITFQYLITEGNTGGVFSVNRRNGRISVPPQGLAFDASSFYSLSIVAENVDDSCQRSRFRLNVRVGRNGIVFPDLAAVSVLETASVGDEVTTIIATGGAGQIEYSLLSSNVPFRIEATTGRILVDGGLNFEDEMQYSIVVQAESVGTIVSGNATQVVNIDDVNEQPEWSTQCARNDICTASITENLPPRALGSRLEVVDPDLPSVPNGVITYTITPNDARVLFSVGSDGTVRTIGPLDWEARDTHTLIVTAADGGTPSLSVTTTFRVTVLDENDVPPTFVQSPMQISIPENEPVDTVIAQYIATDPDTEPNAQITYSLSPISGLPFGLNPDNGALSITQNIDYEDPDSRSFLVTVTANNNPLSTSVQTRIDITDVNDNTPVFQADGYTFTIQEHTNIDSAFSAVLATDADSGLNGDVRYSIRGGNSQGFFSIVSTTGAISVAADIDREQVSSVELRVQARDRGSPRLSSRVTVTVKISDINDNPPVFDPDSYAVSLREDKPVDALAFTVFATDADEPGTDNSSIVYSITQGNTGNAFRIDNSGMVFVNTALNHEALSSYVLTIRADDQGSPQMSDTATAVVSVLNVNEAPPTLSGDQSIDLSESTPTGVIVASFSASDPDFTTVSISIVSGNSEQRFAISDGGDISLVDQLDYEFTSSYTLTIQASDGEQIDTGSLFVNVLDENEFIPQFSGPTEFSIDEEQASGVVVGTVNATDGDGTAPNNAITYSFSTQINLQDHFTLDSTSGEIRTATVLDRELLTDLFPVPSSSLTVQIFARDGGSPSFQTNKEFTITLRDINDNSPLFGDSEYSSNIFENQPSQTILTFSAVDTDLGTNADIRFSFSVQPPSGASLFQLVDDTVGEISTMEGLDCEVVPEYTFTITARDMGNPVRSSNAVGTLTLRDQNDNGPVFAPISSFLVFETTPVFEVVATVTANDADKGLNGEVLYEILGQDDFEEEGETVGFGLPFFEIDSDSGEIRHVTPFNFESFPEVTITVRANDRGTPRLTSTAQVVFTVLNVDESAPRFGRNCRDVTLPENTPADTLIVDCMATDIDNTTTPDDPEWITYTIDSINGNTDDTFRIGLHDGVVRNNVDLDFEANNFFRLVLRATDGSGRSRTDTVDIVVTDENDNAPQFQTQSIRFAMTSEAIESNTQMIATARVADRDAGSNSEIRFSIAGNGIERVSSTETRVVITATDEGATPLTSTATLTVQFDEECLLQKYTIDPSSGEVSAKLLCSVEITPDNTEVVLGEDHIAYCRIARNSPAIYQWIFNGSAIDLTASLSDEQQQATLNVRSVGYQDAGAYACKVTTEAGSLQTSTYTVNILVVPVITLLREPTAVSESASVEFTCRAVGTPAPSISWEFQGGTVATGNTLTIDKADVSTQGDYSCVAVNVAGSTTRDTRLVVFGKHPTAYII